VRSFDRPLQRLLTASQQAQVEVRLFDQVVERELQRLSSRRSPIA
jgi:hypothetical protein